MTGQEALKLIDTLLQTSKQQGLNDLQSAILLATWEGQSYQMLADRLDYEVDYIKQTAAHLWKLIAQLVDENVSKRNIQSVLRRYQETHEVPIYNRMQDWGDAIDVSRFYGRQADLQTLEAWTLKNCCRFIGIFGLGGIGKTALSIKLAQTIQKRFECSIWRSLRQAPRLKDLLEDIVPKLTDIEVDEVLIATLMEQLRQKRCLLVLDNVESILHGGDLSGQYRMGYEDYCQLFEYICDEPHQSCLILTGREKPGGIAVREGTELPVRSLQLQGLSVEPAQQILIDKGLVATTGQYQALVNYFGGNPLAIKIAATTIQSLSGGDVRAFLAQGSTVFSSLCDLLEQQFQRLSTLQQQVMYWVAINREGITPVNLQAKILPKLPLQKLLEVLEVLHERSLIETTETGLSQQPVIMEYVTEHFIQSLEREIIEGKLNLFKTHTLIEAQTQDYLREAQTQLILHPLIERLLTHFGSKTQLEDHLCNILAELRGATSTQTDYAGGNLLNLFCYLKTDLKGFDFSHLDLRQAYLLNAVLHNTDFTDARIEQTVFAETFGGIFSVAFSPDGQRLATSDTKGDIQIWDAQTETQLIRCQGHHHWTWAVAFSPNGQYLASVSDDRLVKLWEVETGRCLQTYEGHTSSVNAVAFNPNGQLLASCGQDATIRLWDTDPKTLKPEIQTLVGHTERIWAIAFSPDGQTLASGGEDCSIRIWDLSTGNCYTAWQAHDRWVRSLAFSPDGKQLASCSYDQTIKLWDIQRQDCIRTFCGHRQPVTAIAFSPNGQYLVSSSFDRTLKLWDAVSGNCLKTFLGHSSRIWSVAYHSNGQQIVSGGDDHATKFWNLKTGRCTKTLVGHTNAVLSLDLSPNGVYLASGHEDRGIRIWDLKKGEIVRTLREHTNRVWSVAFQPATSQPLLASGSADYTLKLWDWSSGHCLVTLQGHKSWIWRIVFSPDGKQLASSSYDHTVKLWDVATGECLKTFLGHLGPVPSVAFSPCEKLLASSEFNGTILLWNVENGECCQTFTGHSERTWSVTFSPDGGRLISASFDRTLKLWDIKTGECLQTFIGHQEPVLNACFSPDGQFIVSAGFDRCLKLWQTATGKCDQTLVGHNGVIFTLLLASVQFNDAESSTLTAFSGGLDESIKVWDLSLPTCLSTWRVPRPYEGMKIRGIQGLSEAQLMTLIALGAVDATTYSY
jgi:WD40 repeat protein